MEKRLYRSRDDRMIWGVCGGIANYFGIEPTIIRVIAVLLTVVSGVVPGIIVYIALAVVVPLENSPSREPKDVVKENVAEIKQTATQFGEEIRSTFARQEGETIEMRRPRHRGGYILAIILIVIGVVFLLGNFNFFWWMRWHYLWPLILIAIGLVIILRPRRS